MVVNFDYNRVIDSIGWWNSIYNNEFIANLVTFNCDFINFDWTVVNWWINGSRRGECGLCYDVGTTIINISTNINRVQSINKSWTTRDRRRLCSTVQLFVTGFVNGTSIFIYLWRVTVCVSVCVIDVDISHPFAAVRSGGMPEFIPLPAAPQPLALR